MKIFEWQNADSWFSKEQMWGGSPQGFNQAAELSQQIIQLVESNGVGAGNILPQ